jgi:hypothetical protein
MMRNSPKLHTGVSYLIAFALFFGLTWKAAFLWEWVRAFTGISALVFLVAGLLALGDWGAYHYGERLREIRVAARAGTVAVSNAIKGLTTFQTEAALAGEIISLELIATDAEPMLRVRGLTRSIPIEFVEDFFTLSIETQPFLYPERETTNKEWATDLTNLIVSRGWAKKGSGSVSAKLAPGIDLRWVAARFWVELPEEEKEPITNA